MITKVTKLCIELCILQATIYKKGTLMKKCAMEMKKEELVITVKIRVDVHLGPVV